MTARKSAVIGATGYIGAHIVQALLARGDDVIALGRDTCKRSNLGDASDSVDFRAVDLSDVEKTTDALRGCDVLFHVAGEISGRDRNRLWHVNVRLAERVVDAAALAGVQRVVYTSSASGLGRPSLVPNTEFTEYESHGFLYMDSKREGQLAVLAASQRTGVEVTVVNPTYCIGAPLSQQVLSNPSTRTIQNYLLGRLPVIVNTLNNFVDVRDVAAGHLLAEEKGQREACYILGGANLQWRDFLMRLRTVSGIDNPIFFLPRKVDRIAEPTSFLGLPNVLRSEPLRLVSKDWPYTSGRAISELGYKARPIDESIAETAEWFCAARDIESASQKPVHRTLRATRALGSRQIA